MITTLPIDTRRRAKSITELGQNPNCDRYEQEFTDQMSAGVDMDDAVVLDSVYGLADELSGNLDLAFR
jgi:hypothetical protein